MMMHAAIGNAIANLLLMIFLRKFLFINSFNLAESQKKELLSQGRKRSLEIIDNAPMAVPLMHWSKSEESLLMA
jgi:hypothetical protein